MITTPQTPNHALQRTEAGVQVLSAFRACFRQPLSLSLDALGLLRFMPTFLFRVDRVSTFAGYVCPSPGAAPAVPGIQVGAAVELLRPDGTRLKAQIASVPIIDPWVPDRPTKIAFRDITPEDIPLGTEVWLQDSPTQT